MAINDARNSKMKHLQIQWHFIRELVSNGLLVIKTISTVIMLADIFTMNLPKGKIQMNRVQIIE
jgi:hypothetical protein